MAKVINLPSNLEAEKSVLAAMLLDPQAAQVALGALTVEDFSGADMRNNLIFRAMAELGLSGGSIDVQTVNNQLVNMKLDQEVGVDYLMELIDTVININNIDHYIDMLHEQTVLRNLLKTMSKIEDEYAKGVDNVSDFILRSNDEITRIAQQRKVSGLRSAKDVAREVNEQLLKSTATSANAVIGVDTGYRKLNDYTHGWQKGNLIILAARPSVGKTALGLNFALQAAKRGVSVAFFSLEMSAAELMKRLLSCESGVDGSKIQTGFLSGQDKSRISAGIDDVSKLKLYIDDSPDAKLGDIISNATKLKNSDPNLGLIVIDYLGRIRTSDKAGASDKREQEVAFISGQLKQLARSLEVPVICLCQLNRQVDANNSKIPSLSNLRESGSIEQDADIVLLMYRPDYYTSVGQSLNQRKRGDKQDEQPAEKNQDNGVSGVQVIVAKNRNGQTGKCLLMFERAYSRFTNPSPEFEENLARQSGEMGDD